MFCSPWGREESDTTERLQFHFSLSCVGEGNGNPLQCSCLENPRDGGAWWAAICGVAQSRTRLKRLSSSSSSCLGGPRDWPLFQEVSDVTAPGGSPGILGLENVRGVDTGLWLGLPSRWSFPHLLPSPPSSSLYTCTKDETFTCLVGE